MAITVADNFSYQGKKPLDGRDGFDTLAQMKAYPEASVYDGCMTYCKEDEKYYTFKASNTVDITTGKWREFSGGGGETYNDFTGATSSTAGAHGLVPAPSAGDEGKVLFGNGAWGALPSVDLSVLSNEAFQFSLTEKPVGTWTDSNNVTKILYAKTYTITSCGDGDNKISHGLSNIDFKGVLGGLKGSVASVTSSGATDGSNRILFNFDATYVHCFLAGGHTGATANITALYTKTTDSPLPSDVKFAGVTAGGDIVLKKTVSTGGSVPSGGTLLYRLPLLNGTDIVYYTT